MWRKARERRRDWVMLLAVWGVAAFGGPAAWNHLIVGFLARAFAAREVRGVRQKATA